MFPSPTRKTDWKQYHTNTAAPLQTEAGCGKQYWGKLLTPRYWQPEKKLPLRRQNCQQESQKSEWSKKTPALPADPPTTTEVSASG